MKSAILGHSPIRNTRFFSRFLSGLAGTKILFASQASVYCRALAAVVSVIICLLKISDFTVLFYFYISDFR